MRVDVIGCVLGAVICWSGHDRRAQLSVRREHAVEADPMQPRTRHQGGEPLQELKRRHHDVGGAVLIRALQLQHHLAGAVALEPFVGMAGRVM